MQASPRLLTHHNLQRLFDEVGSLYKPVRAHQLPGRFARLLRRLIPGEFYGVSIVVRLKRASFQARRDAALYPVPADWENLAETFASQYTKFLL